MRNFCFHYLNGTVFSTGLLILLILCSCFLNVTEVQARSSPYLRGETVAPDCAPGEANCTVSTTTPYYDPSTDMIHVNNTMVGNATTTDLWVGALTGVLRAFNGHVFAGLVDLVNDVIGVLP